MSTPRDLSDWADLPPELERHPDEAELRLGELRLAKTIKDLAVRTRVAIRSHERTNSIVELTRLRDVCEAGRQAMARAIADQMEETKRVHEQRLAEGGE